MDKEGIKTMACQCCALVASVRDLIGHLRHLLAEYCKTKCEVLQCTESKKHLCTFDKL